MTRSKKGSKGPVSISPWGTQISTTFPSVWKRLEPPPANGPVNDTRVVLAKYREASGKAPLIFGWRDPTYFRAYVCKMTPLGGFSYEGVSGGYRVMHSGTIGFNPPLATQSIFMGTSGTGRYPRTSTNLKNRTLTEALNKVADSDINVSESLATLGQTSAMLKDIYIRLAGLIVAAARRDVKGFVDNVLGMSPRKSSSGKRIPGEYVDAAGSNWLQYQYGAKPLINDIRNLCERLRNDSPLHKGVTAIRHLTEEHSLPTSGAGQYGYLVSGRIHSGCKVRLDYAVTNAGLQALNQIGLVNPILLAWELMPFSFVIDWLIPIGNTLEALTASAGLSFKGGSSTSYTIADVQMEYGVYPGTTGLSRPTGNLIRSKVNSISTERTVLGPVPIPRLYMKSPFTNSTRFVTALALLNQLRK